MSKIEVDAITQQSGSTLTVGGGASKTVVADATTVTLGRCGGTVALASGATQSGFGRTGTVDWQTGSIKTATFTAANGEGYFCNTAGGTFEVDLPAGSAGAIVSIQDYNNTFDSNSLTVDPNGSEKINGGAAGEIVTLSTEGQGVTFVYIDATVGWRTVAGSDDPFAQPGVTPTFIAASGGNSCGTVGDFKFHVFTGPGTLCVSAVGNPAGSSTIDYMVVAGGGGGGGTSIGGCYAGGGGGGAGGWRASSGVASGSYTAGPAPLTSPVAAIPVSVQGYPISIGGGGAAGPPTGDGTKGTNTTALGITSTGGGFGGRRGCTGNGGPGGSGGGGGSDNTTAGTGNSPPVTPAQGSSGGRGCGGPGGYGGGGGGGAILAGANPTGSGAGGKAGLGGNGATSNINNSSTAYAGGGGGGAYNNPGGAGCGGAGGGGNGGTPPANGSAGTTNTGGGGGGGSTQGPDSTKRSGGAGGSGIVIVRYKFQ